MEPSKKPTNWVLGSTPAPPPITAAAPISCLGQAAGMIQKGHNLLQSVNNHTPNSQRTTDGVAESEKLYQQAPADKKVGLPPQEMGDVGKELALDAFGQRTKRARSYPSLEEPDQRQEDPRISQTRPSRDGPVSSSSRGGSPYDRGGLSTTSCRRTMSEAASTDGKNIPGSRKYKEQQKFNQLQEQEQARALAATLRVVDLSLCYFAQKLSYYAQTHGTSPTSVSGFNNTTITGDVNISNTVANSDGAEIPCPTSPSGEKGDVLPYHFTRTFRSGLVWGSGTVLAALFLMYATGSLVYYQRPLPECTRLHN